MTIRWGAVFARRAAWLALVLALALMIAPATASAVVTANVTGTILDAETGAGIFDADVYLYSPETDDWYNEYSVEGGVVTFTDVMPGEYYLDVWADGYEDYSELFEVVAGENTFTAELTPIVPNVSGTVTDEGDEPVGGVDVWALTYDTDEGIWWENDWTSTDEDGQWGMNLYTGVYRFGFNSETHAAQYFDGVSSLDAATNVTVWPFRTVTGIDAQLAEKTPAVTGTITADDSGQPIAGAEVWAAVWNAEEEYYDYVDYAVTDESGEYAFYDLEPGTYYFEAYSEVYRLEFYDDVTDIESATAVEFTGTTVEDIDFVLTPSVLAIAGVVTDASSSMPVAEVPVAAFTLDGESGEWFDVYWSYTDADGRYEIYDLSPDTYRVGYTGESIWADDNELYFAPSFWDGATSVETATDIVVTGGQLVDGHDFALTEAVPTVTGTVTSDSAPVEGVEVDAMIYDEEYDEFWSVANDITAADGTYEFYAPGTFRVRVSGGGMEMPLYRTEWWNDATSYDTADDVVASYGSTVSGIDFDLAPLEPFITGTVVDFDGIAVDGVAIAVQWQDDEEGGDWYYVGAGEIVEGEYAILPEGEIDYDQPVRVVFHGFGPYFPEFYDNARTIQAATDIDIDPAAPVVLPEVVLDEYVAVATRIASDTRFSTAVAMAKSLTDGWNGVNHVILASGDDRAAADPLAASGLSWAYRGAPILLTPAGSTPASLTAAFKEIVENNGEVTIHVVGGRVSVPDARVNDILKALDEDAELVEIDRIAGASRYDNAKLISARMLEVRPDMPDFALVANGADATKFFDALALSAVSARTGAPILLVSANSVPAATASAIESLPISPGNIFVAGGAKTVTSTVFKQLGITEANRLAGPTRYSTAVAVADWAIENGWLDDGVVGVAAKLPDALSGGALVGARGGVLLVTDSKVLSEDTAEYLFEHAPAIMENVPAEIYVFGGSNSVTKPVIDEINMILAFDEDV